MRCTTRQPSGVHTSYVHVSNVTACILADGLRHRNSMLVASCVASSSRRLDLCWCTKWQPDGVHTTHVHVASHPVTVSVGVVDYELRDAPWGSFD